MRYLAHGEETQPASIKQSCSYGRTAEALAQRLADKPYGAPEKPEPEKQCRTTISLGESMLVTIEDLALRNKRNGKDPKNVSAIVRVALEQYLKTLT